MKEGSRNILGVDAIGNSLQKEAVTARRHDCTAFAVIGSEAPCGRQSTAALFGGGY